MGPARLAELRNQTVEVFRHGFDNYMQHAFPEDELRPVSCTPLSRDATNDHNYDLNDVLGNYSLTLIDSLSTLAILAGTPSDPDTATWALREFQDGIEKFVENHGDGRKGPSGQGRRARGFDLDSKVQVFETVIRVVGGLLSAHLFAVGELPIPGYEPVLPILEEGSDPLELPPIPWPSGFRYDGQLLRLALDLGERLLPAFYTKTGLPYPRVNLRHGIPFYVNSPLHKTSPNPLGSSQESREKTDTCSAGAGSLVLEFAVLSRLTGDSRFENLAKRAFWAVWSGKSDIGLVGNAIDPEKGEWVSYDTGIGAGVDSFFEYAFKSHILLSGHDLPNATTRERSTGREWLDPDSLHPRPLTPEEHSPGAFLEVWHQAHAAIRRHLYNDIHHPYYMTGHRTRGHPFTFWIDSLAAFYPGLLAVAGEVDEAEQANLLYTALWTRYGALPERWSVRDRQIDSGIGWWPGRPEFIESTYYLYRATNDPWYLYVGEMVLADINRLCRTPCGWSGLQNVDTKEKADRMQSFFLGETTKYLYLLFDPDHPFNKLDAAYVFSTEAHPLIIPQERRQHRQTPDQRRRRTPEPPHRRDRWVKDVNVYWDESYTNSCPAPAKEVPLTGSVLASRPDVFHAASFVNLHKAPNPHGGVEAVPAAPGSNETVMRSLTNHSLFPWTLPTSMLPENGICSALSFKPTFIIEFPSVASKGQHAGSAFNQFFANAAAFKTELGVKIVSLNGLRVTFVQEESSDPSYDHVWRITAVNLLGLGKDELVHIDADLLAGITDPLFNRVRYHPYADLVLVFDDPVEENATIEIPAEDVESTVESPLDAAEHEETPLAGGKEAPGINHGDHPTTSNDLDASYQSMLKSLVRRVTSVFDPLGTATPRHPGSGGSASPRLHVQTYKAALPVGQGAAPLPDVPDAPFSLVLGEDADHATTHSILRNDFTLPWSTVYLAGEACDGRLPDEAPRDHHIIVLRRGGCTFSAKLANIPSHTPSPHSVQLVVVVDDSNGDADGISGQEGFASLPPHLRDALVYGGGAQAGQPPWHAADDLTRPRLDVPQHTPGGLPRHRPVPMVLIRAGGGERGDAYEQFRRAKGVGVRRKYLVETQGRRVENLVVL
ncbi:glycoside hydrolase family 47 protein [Sodiomyces alcalophilus JCM 7366]|uniref:glycoside hydrolase family 47 protein n=1 Tax=Sodiomyces alcalophilus JCM 7366 TaxID=591952 RepID=UPI0039B5BFC2